MHVLLTSSHGFVGSRITDILQAKGHSISGLVRSEAAAAKLQAKGITVVRATLEQPEKVAEAAKKADAVIHTAFDHNFADWEAVCQKDSRVVSAILDALEGTHKPFIYTSGFMQTYVDGPIQETDLSTPEMGTRAITERFVVDSGTRGIRTMVIRLPPTVHGPNDWGFIPHIIKIAREKGVSAYSSGGEGAWSSVHVKDAAEVYAAALERGQAGKVYHAVDDVEIPFQKIAEVIAEGVGGGIKAQGVPKAELGQYLGFFSWFAGKKPVGSAEITKKELAWEPKEINWVREMKEGDYFEDNGSK